MTETPRRIGILTFHRCINYGSYWQARCLAEGLRAWGHDAQLLDHHSDDVARAEWRCSFQPALPQRSPRIDLPAYKAKNRKFLAAFDTLPQSPRFPLHRPEDVAGYDAIVVGSDEVWNFRHPWYGGKPIFFGDGLNVQRLISYAASFGNHDAEEGIGDPWSDRLSRFTAVSVRDDNSRRLVEHAIGESPTLVLDPCLQFADRIPRDPADDGGRPYALVYGHGFPEWLQRSMRGWADRHGVGLLSIGYRNDWADEQQIDAGPDEFAARVAGARAMVTNFFHGCVFALVNRTPFVTAPSPYRFNKVRDLAAALDAQRHIVGATASEQDFDDLLAAPPAAVVYERIDRLRTQSTDYLRRALG